MDHFGEDAGKFDLERWFKRIDPPEEHEVTGLTHLSFGTVSRACSGQHIAGRLFLRGPAAAPVDVQVRGERGRAPNTDYVEYNEFKTALVAIPRYLKVWLIPRDPEATAEALELAEQWTREPYKE